MNKIPIIVAKFLSLQGGDGFTVHDKFAYLIKSLNGDSYYLYVQLPEEGFITEELGHEVYEALIDGVSYEDVFNWYNSWEDVK